MMKSKQINGSGGAFTRKTSVIFKAATKHLIPRIPQGYKNDILEPLTSIKDAREEKREQVVIKKLQQCCTLFDFHDATSEITGKRVKSATLQELIDYIGRSILFSFQDNVWDPFMTRDI